MNAFIEFGARGTPVISCEWFYSPAVQCELFVEVDIDSLSVGKRKPWRGILLYGVSVALCFVLTALLYNCNPR